MITNKILIAVVVVAVIAVAAYIFWPKQGEAPEDAGITASQQSAESDNEQQEQVPPTASEAESGIVGVWQSNEEEQFVREFVADGTVVDKYEGEGVVTSYGRWTIFTDTMSEPVELPSVEGATYIRLVFNEETLYFIVAEVKSDYLVLMSLNQDDTITFTRAK